MSDEINPAPAPGHLLSLRDFTEPDEKEYLPNGTSSP